MEEKKAPKKFYIVVCTTHGIISGMPGFRFWGAYETSVDADSRAHERAVIDPYNEYYVMESVSRYRHAPAIEIDECVDR